MVVELNQIHQKYHYGVELQNFLINKKIMKIYKF